MLYDQAGRSAVRRQLFWLYGLGGAPIILGLAVVILEPARLLRWFYGTTYAAFPAELTLMAVFYGLWFAYAPLQIALKAVRRTQPIFVANAISLTLMLTVGVAAIRAWGVLGTVVGQALGALVVGVFLWFGWRQWLRDPSLAAPVSASMGAESGARSEASGPARVANEARTPQGTRPPEA
jgi:O-antigen/teichoic acid export membrane protein